MKELPKYQCHKTVHALKLDAIKFDFAHLYPGRPVEAVFTLIPVDKDHKAIRVDMDFMYRHRPQPGGYYLVYEDGYESYSPPAAFEKGYTPYNPYNFDSIRHYVDLQRADEELWGGMPINFSEPSRSLDLVYARLDKLRKELRDLHAVIDRAAGSAQTPLNEGGSEGGSGSCKDGACSL